MHIPFHKRLADTGTDSLDHCTSTPRERTRTTCNIKIDSRGHRQNDLKALHKSLDETGTVLVQTLLLALWPFHQRCEYQQQGASVIDGSVGCLKRSANARSAALEWRRSLGGSEDVLYVW